MPPSTSYTVTSSEERHAETLSDPLSLFANNLFIIYFSPGNNRKQFLKMAAISGKFAIKLPSFGTGYQPTVAVLLVVLVPCCGAFPRGRNISIHVSFRIT